MGFGERVSVFGLAFGFVFGFVFGLVGSILILGSSLAEIESEIEAEIEAEIEEVGAGGCRRCILVSDFASCCKRIYMAFASRSFLIIN